MTPQKITALLVGALLVIAGIFTWQLARPQVNTVIEVSPTGATLLLDGHKTSGGTLYAAPGKHTVVAEQSGFAKQTQSFNTQKGQGVRVTLLLNPNSDEGYAYLDNHPDEQTHREAIGGDFYANDTAQKRHTYPILTLLPHTGNGFQIDYGASQKDPKDPTKIALYITSNTTGYESRALNWIRFSGYNPSDYEIVYQYNDAKD